MKTSLSICLLLLLLSLILSQVQGIRLEKGFSSAGHQKIQVEEGSPIKITSNGGLVGEVTLCRDGHCSSGINRKLMTKTTSTSSTTPTTNSKNVKNGGKSGDQVPGREEENFYVNASPVSEHPEAAPEGYPDIIDIAGMDYSPARRKPPIHN
ncbi:uncharacterized protein LOC117925426 [Vitis riparia]|uniref:uncharacterized protein LOC117925426 n=1 Tax=Vitis riparia TaxID=96939 RepID=UPI00155B2DC8|nr:uncharacterized protein LOC117925426 [Vitis riparia]